MTNRMKAKGDRYERDMRELFRANGFPGCERTKAGYERDAGDLHLDPVLGIGPGVIVQCKDVKTPLWSEWLDGLTEQVGESRAEVGFIAWKRSRPGKAPLNLAVMPVDAMTYLLRRAGYGTALGD
ncbi:hypothetical protein [Antrihabitans cavernicola]|uniref:Holliday junction resolvase n=1 Tax=Antrihabitans cavernicola TaxID=2495913 RepID=A0A5A7SC52_9NOCA|nr:hypothetical protein [Spelaeibacter cavernicola]KAA0021821.1 hypothetical protein FOY51_15585 [Spelaeibacter cavernicola]